ncbi:hypothetical protein B0O99DRAFT_695013 [Bisporella sp. PMI_857]|nr:hypothetical protein B0O99DRAFT_695013 [Bisporella sp. PMI_857]
MRGHGTDATDSAAGAIDRSSTARGEGVGVKKTDKRCEQLEQRSSTPLSTILIWIGWIAAIFVQFICAILISLYDVSRSDIVHRPYPLPPLVSIPSNDTLSLWRLPFIRDIPPPSTPVFTNAVMVYGSAVLVAYNLRNSDPYQNHILLLGILGGAILHVYITGFEGSMARFKDFMPAVISLSLVISVGVHQVLR